MKVKRKMKRKRKMKMNRSSREASLHFVSARGGS